MLLGYNYILIDPLKLNVRHLKLLFLKKENKTAENSNNLLYCLQELYSNCQKRVPRSLIIVAAKLILQAIGNYQYTELIGLKVDLSLKLADFFQKKQITLMETW